MTKCVSKITVDNLVYLDPKVAFFDVDGTLVNSQHQVSEEIRASLAKLKQAGVKLGLASGRAYFAAKRLIHDLNFDGPCCMFSGALLIDPCNNEIILESSLSKETSLTLVKLAAQENLQLELYTFRN